MISFFKTLFAKDLSQFAKRDPAFYQQKTTKQYYRIWKNLIYYWACLSFDIRFLGQENLPDVTKNLIVVSNHSSNLDPFLVGVALKKQLLAFMAKQELFVHPLSRCWMNSVGTFSVNRQKMEIATIRTSKVVLNSEDWALGIFPEGTRNKTGEVGESKKGAAYLAKANKSTVLPVAVVQRDKKIRIQVGKPIPYQGEDVDTLTQIITDTIAALKKDTEQKLEAELSQGKV